MSQIITVTFAEGQREAIAAEPLEQWAYGQTLQFEGLELPQAYRVDFSNFEYCGASIPRVGGPDGVAVPVEVLTSGRNVYAFIWVQDETSGARYRRATVRVVPGPEPDTDESPEEQSAVTEAINALNAAAEAIPEQIDTALAEAKASGEFDGPPGQPGQAGAPGAKGDPGDDGISPTVSVTTITGGHRVTIVDAQGTHVFDVMNGEKGDPGSGGDNVFWATYNSTTEAEITAAVTAGKTVLCKISDEIFYLVSKAAIGPSGSAWIFASANQTSMRVTWVSGSYWNSIGTRTIPTKTSDLTNDSGFVNASGAAAAAPVQSVNGQTGAVVLNAADVGAGTYSKPASGIPASDLAAGVIPANMVLYDDSGSGTSAAETIPLVDTNGVTWYLGVDTSGVPFVGDTNNQVVWVPTQSSYASGDEVSY